MNDLMDLMHNREIPSYIFPLFWQHGEEEATLRDEIHKMHENGIGGFIVESRPHPDYLGEGWWHDLDVIIDEAKKRNMKVWIFDDYTYPSGFAAGRIRDQYPNLLKTYLAERHLDAVGHLNGSSFLVHSWVREDEQLVGVVAARRADGRDALDGASFLELTDNVNDGILYWDVPEGQWRLFFIVSTRKGGEEETKDYLNPLVKEATRAFIDTVYEEHYRRYPLEFGKTIAGFFSDEPRFGNAASYEASLGRLHMVLPYCDALFSYLDVQWQGNFKKMLPCLWYDAGDVTGRARYVYMNVVSRLYAENFTCQIGDWCRQHHVKLIGHVVEDNGAHARLGYGAGHFFRSIEGQDYSGLDVVYQVWPEYDDGFFTTPFGYLDADFFYWGIAKMASSAGHLDPKKQGITACEIFGAYGWQEGLKLMKWLTDHVCVRGINFLIPHAFSPKYTDPDCPPHFYARGANPQWRYFHIWSGYANRVCHLLSGGKHEAPVAVLYHAEAEWAGAYEPFEKVVKSLAKVQIDCDVLPIDALRQQMQLLEPHSLTVNQECYRALVIPYAEALPEKFIETLFKMAMNQIPVIFMKDYPRKCSDEGQCFDELMDKLKKSPYCMTTSHEQLVFKLEDFGCRDIKIHSSEPYLRHYKYIHGAQKLYFFTNESTTKTIRTRATFQSQEIPAIYCPMDNKMYYLSFTQDGQLVTVDMYLEPYESLFILFFSHEDLAALRLEQRLDSKGLHQEYEIKGPWAVSLAEAHEYPSFGDEPRIVELGNISVAGVLPDFSGTIRYQTRFCFEGDTDLPMLLSLGGVYETAAVSVNGQMIGIRICPPYHLAVTGLIQKRENLLEIHVTNTLAKKVHDVFSRAMPQEPSGLLGPVSILY
ncbi:MAG: hypothetical protein DDT32_01239 [Syntrophomonadaceae bacterium]|nr:hypothetical protein [Bacillota bacterium]